MYKINILNFYFNRARSFNQWQRASYKAELYYKICSKVIEVLSIVTLRIFENKHRLSELARNVIQFYLGNLMRLRKERKQDEGPPRILLSESNKG